MIPICIVSLIPRREDDHKSASRAFRARGSLHSAGKRGKTDTGESSRYRKSRTISSTKRGRLKSLVGEGTVEPVEWKAVSRAIGGARIYFFMSAYDRIFSVHFADPAPEITDQLIERLIFRFSREVPIEIPHQADADGDIIEIIAVNVSAVQLPDPTVADLDLTVS